jgi:hypothetical protein
MAAPASSRSRAGVTTLMVFAPAAAVFGLLATIATLLSTINTTAGPYQVAGYSCALALELVPALALLAIAITGRRFSSTRRYAAGVFGVVCVAAGLYYTAPLLVDAIATTAQNERLRQLPVAADEKEYSVSDLRGLSHDFLADSTSTLDRPHPVRPVGGFDEPCQLGNLDDGTLLRSAGGDLFWTFDTREAAIAAIVERWEAKGFEVSVEGGTASLHDEGWLRRAEARWVPAGVDYNLSIDYETVCVAEQ